MWRKSYRMYAQHMHKFRPCPQKRMEVRIKIKMRKMHTCFGGIRRTVTFGLLFLMLQCTSYMEPESQSEWKGKSVSKLPVLRSKRPWPFAYTFTSKEAVAVFGQQHQLQWWGWRGGELGRLEDVGRFQENSQFQVELMKIPWGVGSRQLEVFHVQESQKLRQWFQEVRRDGVIVIKQVYKSKKRQSRFPNTMTMTVKSVEAAICSMFRALAGRIAVTCIDKVNGRTPPVEI